MFDTHPELDCGGRRLRLDRKLIMGVVNVTPDSFSDGGRFDDPERAAAHGLLLVEQGADVLDVGGESTRPGANEVTLQQELDRVIPVVEKLASRCGRPISIDTSKPEVMKAAVAAGAGMINDVYALRRDGALEAAASLSVPVCLMHMQGEPRGMQADPHYDDVVDDVRRFLADRVFACEMAGMSRKQLLVDPGFGFGKTLEHNLRLLRQLGSLTDLGLPILAGLSRKSMIGVLTGREIAADRTIGSIAAAVIAAQGGATFIRVHDVAETREALNVLEAVLAQPAAAERKAAPTIRWPDED